jgi:vitamin K-dependent gamma-carboxylase-like protein
MRRGMRRLENFLFPADSDTWLSILRIGIATQVLLYSVSLRADWNDLFSLSGAGLIKRDLTEAVLSAKSHFIPRMAWLVDVGGHLGLNEQTVLTVSWWLLLFAGFCLLAGLFSRAAAIGSLFLHLCAVKSTDALSYGVDNFTTIGLFYLMIAPWPDRWGLDRFLWKAGQRDPHLLGFHRRILQLHLCLIYFFGGIAKCAGAGWWDGTSIWRALIRPPFNMIPPELLVMGSGVFPALSISVCLLETGYPFFIWLRRTRSFWFGAVLAMHLGIGLAMGLYLFALVMVVLNIASFGPGFAFGQSEETRPVAQEVIA